MPPCSETYGQGSVVDETDIENVNTDNRWNKDNITDRRPVAADDYDSVGAMQFVVCTIVVYAFFGVFCILVVRFRKGTASHASAKRQADAINNYLKKEESLKLEGFKIKMLKEIEKHSESIRVFEERMRLLEIQRDIKTDAELSSHKKGKAKRKRKNKHVMHIPQPNLGRRRFSAADAIGRAGISTLFMEPNISAVPKVSESAEEIELQDVSQPMLKYSSTLPVSEPQAEAEVTVHALPDLLETDEDLDG